MKQFGVNANVKGIQTRNTVKNRLFVSDIVLYLFLTNLQPILAEFGKSSGLTINQDKAELFPIRLEEA